MLGANRLYSAAAVLAALLLLCRTAAAADQVQMTKLAVTDISITSAKVSWITDKLSTDNRVEVREKGSDSVAVHRDEYLAGTYTHVVTVINLKVDTEYEYRVRSGDTTWDNGGTWYSFRTFPFNTSTALPQNVTGRLTDRSGQPVKRALIRITVSRGSEESVPLTIVSQAHGQTEAENGTWLVDISRTFNPGTKTYFDPWQGDSLIIEYLPNFWTSDIDRVEVGNSFPQYVPEKVIDLFDPNAGVRGDLNNDGKINIFDLLDMLKVLGGSLLPSSDPRLSYSADVDGNGRHDIFDLLALLRLLSGATT